MNTTTFLTALATALHLGPLTKRAVRVHGGFLHKMYRLHTATGTYAVKLLNPNIMQRQSAMANYATADALEATLQKHNIPIVPSLVFGGTKMQVLEGQYFYVYDWFNGKPLHSKSITALHCQKISAALSRIHQIDIKNEPCKRNPVPVDWDAYIALAKTQNPQIYALLTANRALLYESQTRGNSAIKNIPSVVSICHNDMDSKNVLWQNDTFRLIDLECLAYNSPYLELFELALCWSGYEECELDLTRFAAFITAYFGNAPKPDIDWETMYDCNFGRLEWLEYNLKRALLIECGSPEEQALGTAQVTQTIDHVIYYAAIKQDLLNILAESFAK